ARAAGGKGLYRAGQDTRRDRGQGTDPDRAGLGRAARHIESLPQGGEAGCRIAVEDLAEGGEKEIAPAAVEQAAAQEVFEFLNGLGDGGLADMQGGGGMAHVAQAGHLEKAGQVPQLDARIDALGQSRSPVMTGGRKLPIWAKL